MKDLVDSHTDVALLLRRVGRSMSRSKYQRPEVKLWTGQSGERLWQAEWRQYIAGRSPKHRRERWPCSRYTKAAAQKLCDRLVREETDGPVRPDGGMTVTQFWDTVYWSMRSKIGGENTHTTYETSWRKHIKPVIGDLEMQAVQKSAIDLVLAKMVPDAAQVSKSKLDIALTVMRQLFDEAVENDFIPKNPTRRVALPNSRPARETRPLTEDEARRVWSTIPEPDLLILKTYSMTGMRASELYALEKADIVPEGLRITKSALNGKVSGAKHNSKGIAPLAAQLRKELENWAASIPGTLLFPNKRGEMHRHNGGEMISLLRRARKIACIPDLTFRQLRTTFGTLYGGDPRDLQGILRHRKLDTTFAHYKKPITERQQAGVEELYARLSGKVQTITSRPKAAGDA